MKIEGSDKESSNGSKSENNEDKIQTIMPQPQQVRQRANKILRFEDNSLFSTDAPSKNEATMPHYLKSYSGSYAKIYEEIETQRVNKNNAVSNSTLEHFITNYEKKK